MLTRRRATIRHIPGRENTLDESAFDVVTPESAYWVGFLMATGSITRAGTRSPAIAVTTADEDRAHLERFRSFVKAMEPITVGTRDGFRDASRSYLSVQVRSARLARTLARYGVVPYKALVAKAFELEGNRHFWRGCIDGDGSLSLSGDGGRRRPVLSFACRSRELASQFAQFIRAAVPGCEVDETTRSPRAYCVVHSVTVRDAGCAQLTQVLYGDGVVASPRKQKIARQIMREGSRAPQAIPRDIAPAIAAVSHLTGSAVGRPGTMQPRLF
jgi:hypothetical protein